MQELQIQAPIAEWAHDVILEMQQPPKGYGVFIVKFDNRKRRGRGQPIQYCEAWGTLYPSKHVHLDTQDIPVADYRSLQQMREALERIGHCNIEWQFGGPA